MSKIKYYYEIEQGTDVWLTARLGIVTASEINNLVTPTGKKASGAKVHAFACEIASQRVNMEIEDNFQSFDMLRGHIQEEIAREVYGENINDVAECGFIVREFDGFKIGASPDGLIGDDGGIEIKSRKAKFQVSTIVSGEVPSEYVNQIQTFLLVSGRKWCDFVQYSNGMPLFTKRVYPDETRQNAIIDAVSDFEKLVVEVQGIYAGESKNMIQTERVDLSLDDTLIGSEVE